MEFTVENIEFYALILVRISTFIAAAPIYSMRNIPMKAKIGLSVFTALIMFQTIPYEPLSYTGVLGFTGLLLKEAVAGVMIGFMANICTYILGFAGTMIDMEIGLSMVSMMDPSTSTQSTITSTYYQYFVFLIMLATNMHHFIIYAITDTFKVVPVGQIQIHIDTYLVMARFLVDYFIIGFRIILPVFAATLMVNAVLGILVKIAPQMNMFVIGMQIKIFVGLFMLFLAAGLLPQVTDFIIEEMKTMIMLMTKAISP